MQSARCFTPHFASHPTIKFPLHDVLQYPDRFALNNEYAVAMTATVTQAFSIVCSQESMDH